MSIAITPSQMASSSSSSSTAGLLRPRQSLPHPFGRLSSGICRSLGGRKVALDALNIGSRSQQVSHVRFASGSRESRTDSQQVPESAAVQHAQQPLQRLKAAAAACAMAASLAVSPLSVSSAMAADSGQVGTCLLESCQTQLAGCLTDGNCLQNLVCLNKCNGRPDESECQIKCGDLYEDKAVQAFNECAVSAKKCVPQRIDNDLFPVPARSARVDEFDLTKFTGRWYITAGLNPLFDTFPCQEHYFGNPEPGVLFGKINWRVPKGDGGDFLQRGVTQTFRQTSDPAVLLNHNNAYLHYEDDWYILASKPDEYVLIYYIGNNDAWRGYGGATVYTREKSLPKKYIPEIKEALTAANINYTWDDFAVTDNSCPPKPIAKSLLSVLSDDFKEAEKDVEQLFTSFGKGFTLLETNLERTLEDDEKEFERELKYAEEYLAGIEKQYQTTIFDLPPFKWFAGKKAPSAVITPLTGGPLKAGDVADADAPCKSSS